MQTHDQNKQKKKISYVISYIKSVDKRITFPILDIILLDSWFKKKSKQATLQH